MNLSYPNPWHHGYNGPEVFERHNVQAWVSGRGMIVKVSERQYDYLIDGRVVSQRGGCDMELLERMIAEGWEKVVYGEAPSGKISLNTLSTHGGHNE